MIRNVYLLLCCTLFAQALGAQTTIAGSFEFNNQTRNYRLHLPTGYADLGTMPLVFNMHGFGSNSLEQEFYSGMNPVSDAEGFLVCYPDGIANAWNVGWAFGSTSDDVGFISALIDTIAAQYSVNVNRVYACGMSNGGFMSYRLACELNDRIAAIASVTGAMSPQYLPICEPGRAVPVLEIHGTADDVVNYDGTVGVNVPVDSVVQFWVDNNACNAAPLVTEIPNTNMADLTTVTHYQYGECTNEAAVELMKVNGGGHTWPGSPFIIGITNQDINASVEIWRFFNRYQLDGVISSTNTLANQQQAWQVYPNPGQEVLNFKNISAPFQLTVFDMQGRQHFTAQANKTTDIAVQQLPAGVYFIELVKDQQVMVVKWVKD